MGRPRRFDEEALLDCARELFWSNGYSETSLEDVSRASGVGNGSIYAAYGSKKGLYLAVLRRYCGSLAADVGAAMAGRTGDARASLRAYLEMIICDCITQPGRRGCLMLNSIVLVHQLPEVREIITATTGELEDHVAARLIRDGVGGDTASDAATVGRATGALDPQALGAHFVTLSQGLIQRSRLGDDPAALRSVADMAVAHLATT